MTSEFEDAFCEIEKTFTPETYGDTVVNDIESKFTGQVKNTPEQISREEEKKVVEAKLKKLKAQLRGCKNAKNIHRKKVNDEMHRIRESIREKIGSCELRLQQIKDEEIGSHVDAVSMVNAAKESQMNDILNGVSHQTKVTGWADL